MTAASPGLANPFPGLRPFEEDESDRFFGRETQTDELLRRLGRSRFVAVVGTSGSGKSSLVRAGLLPALVGGLLTDAGSHWRIAEFRPGGDPIGRLGDALHAAFPAAAEPEEERFRRDMLETSLLRSSLGLVEAARQAPLAPHENLLVVVDQFEELFRFGRLPASDGGNRAAFVRLLLQAIGQQEIPIHVLITMRSDFLGDCAQFPDLPETINEGLYLIPRMTRDQLRQAITAPAAVTGTGITPRLVQQLLNDVGDDPDQLPLLQHALMRMWDRASRVGDKDKSIDLEDYEAIGGMADALSRHANESWERIADESVRELAKRMFQCLTEKGPDNREVRRPTTLGQMCGILETDPQTLELLVNHFRTEGRAFLTPTASTRLDRDSIVDISHESLIRKWDRLRHWADEEAESATEYRRLAEAATLNRAGRLGLWSNPALQVALNWKRKTRPNRAWAERYAPDFELAMGFLDRSVVEEKAAAQRGVQAVRTEKMRRRLAVLTILGTTVSAVFGWLLLQNSKLLNETRAVRVAVQAALLASQKDAGLTKSVQLAAESMRLNPSPDSDEVMRNGLALLPRQFVGFKHNDKVNSVAFSRDGKYLATGSYDNYARVFDLTTKKEIWRLNQDDLVHAVAFSPDGRFVATAGADKSARVIEVSTGKQLLRIDHTGYVLSVAFNSDGRLLATGSADNIARVLKADTGLEVLRVVQKGAVNAVMFSPNDRLLATASDDKTARVIDAVTGHEVFRVVHRAAVEAAVFSPMGHFLATASADGTARVVVAATGKEVSRVGQLGKVHSVAFSPDDRLLATGSEDGTARVLVAATGGEVSRLKHQGSVDMVAFSPDGDFVATASQDDTARVLEALTGHEVSRLSHKSNVVAVAFSPNGQYVATGSADGRARVFEATTGKGTFHISNADDVAAAAFSEDGRFAAIGELDKARVIDTRDGHVITSIKCDSVYSVAFSPDGKQLAIGGADGTLRVTDAATGQELTRHSFQGALNAVSFSPDGRYLAAAGADKTAHVIDWRSHKAVSDCKHSDDVKAVVFSPDGQWIATGSDDKAATVFRAATGLKVRSYPHQDAVVAVEFSPDGKYLATGSVDNTARLIERATGKEVYRLTHLDWVYGVAFSRPNGRYLATASRDKTALIVERATGKRLSRITHEGMVIALEFSDEGKYLETFAGDTFSRNLVRPQDLISEACARLSRNLTHEEWDQYFPEASYHKTCPNLPSQ